MYFMICKAVDMAPQPIRCLLSGDNKQFWKKKKKIGGKGGGGEIISITRSTVRQ